MTLQITQVHDAAYLSDGRVLFRCDCGDITDVYCEILPGHRNAPNNRRLQRWLNSNTPTDYVEPTAVPPHNERRQERQEVFSRTLDRLNPVWHDALTPTQQTALATWRQAWLDYPATGIRPADLEGIFD